MVYESSYESGRMPFSPDTTRGYWALPNDYIWACLCLTINLQFLSMPGSNLFATGVVGIIIYMICLFLYVVPLMVLHSFMGQFSRSGFISSFRIAPIFKGMGYVALAVNISALFYSTLLAAVPMFFMLNSLRPTLPWSCAAIDQWSTNLTEFEMKHTCNITIEDNFTSYELYNLPSVLYFNRYFEGLLGEQKPSVTTFSFTLMFCILLIWSLIAVVFYYCQNISRFGVFLRYAFWTFVSLLVVCLLRFSFLEGAHTAISEYFTIESFFVGIPVIVLNSLGQGWGVILTLASFNKFKTDIMSVSWIVCIGQMFMFIALTMVISLTEAHFYALTKGNYYHDVTDPLIFFLSGASALSEIPIANFWCLLFFGMLSLGSIVVMSTQLLNILTSLFDEFAVLRSNKFEVTFGAIGILAIITTFYCTNIGFNNFFVLCAEKMFSQGSLNLLILLVMLWVYGRERFQRDIDFMVSRPFSSYRVFMLRYIAPICLILILLASLMSIYVFHLFFNTNINWYLLILTILTTFVPWLILPGYATNLIIQSSGTIMMRLKRACRPNDWYPIEPEHRQKYEEAMNNMDITHQLTEVTENSFL